MEPKENSDHIAQQEKALRLPRFDAAVAWDLGTRIRELAILRGLIVVIDVRRFGLPLFYSALEGATPENVEWARRKGNTVERFHTSSLSINLRSQLKKSTIHERQGLPVADFAADGGSFPINVEGVGVIGSATVSGLTAREDHELVVEALCGLLGKDYAELKLPEEKS